MNAEKHILTDIPHMSLQFGLAPDDSGGFRGQLAQETQLQGQRTQISRCFRTDPGRAFNASGEGGLIAAEDALLAADRVKRGP